MAETETIADCIQTLLSNDLNPDANELSSTWTLPNEPQWEDYFQDTTLEIVQSEISDVLIPQNSNDWISCESLDDNNGQIFEEDEACAHTGSSATVSLTSNADVEVTGPYYNGHLITADADVLGQASCIAPFYSRLVTSWDSANDLWALEDLVMYADGSVTFSAGTSSLATNNVRIQLLDASLGNIIGGVASPPTYELSAGSAYFAVVGLSTFYGIYVATNATDIVATESDGNWSFSAFGIEYIDTNDDTWEIEIPATTWE